MDGNTLGAIIGSGVVLGLVVIALMVYFGRNRLGVNDATLIALLQSRNIVVGNLSNQDLADILARLDALENDRDSHDSRIDDLERDHVRSAEFLGLQQELATLRGQVGPMQQAIDTLRHQLMHHRHTDYDVRELSPFSWLWVGIGAVVGVVLALFFNQYTNVGTQVVNATFNNVIDETSVKIFFIVIFALIGGGVGLVVSMARRNRLRRRTSRLQAASSQQPTVIVP